MKLLIVLLFFTTNFSFAQGSKTINCAGTTCTPDFEPDDQFEKIYYTSIDAGKQNVADIAVETNANQSPRSLRLYVENNDQEFPASLNLDLHSKNSEFAAGDSLLIGDYFKNLNINANGYAGIIGKPASRLCAEKFQLGGSLGYGDFARAEFQAKRLSNPSLPTNQCVYSDVEFLQQNNFKCDEENFNELLTADPTVSVRRLIGKTKCLGVGFQKVCLQRTVEVTCKWTLKYLEPASLAGQFSTHPSETITKKFTMFEDEYNLKYNLNPTHWGKYFCNSLTKGTQTEPASVELIKNSSFSKNANDWSLYGNAQWVNGKIKNYSGPILNDPSDGINLIKSIPGVGNPSQQSFNGYNADIVFSLVPKSPVKSLDPNHVTTSILYQRNGFSCNFSKNECYYSAPPNGAYYNNLLLATLKLEDKNGFKSYYDLNLDIGYDYDQSSNFVGRQGKLACGYRTWNASIPWKFTTNKPRDLCANGSCYRNDPLNAVRRWYPNASNVLSWHVISGDWRKGCKGDYIFAVGYHFFLNHYPRARLTKRYDIDNWPRTTAEQTVFTEIGKTYRVTGLMKSVLEETRPASGKVKLYADASKQTLLKEVKYNEVGLVYPLVKSKLTFIDFTFVAASNYAVLELSQDNETYSTYFDDISIKNISLFAGPPVQPTEPPSANASGISGIGYYELVTAPTQVRTSPAYDQNTLEPLPGSTWKVVYTAIGEECPLYGNVIPGKEQYLATHTTYDENDNQCDDVTIPQDPNNIFVWRNIGFERRPEFGQESLLCSLTSCPINATVQNLPLVYDTINTGIGVSGTERGEAIAFIYDSTTIASSSANGQPGSPGPNDLPDLTTNKVCARVQDAITQGEDSEFARNPVVQFKKYQWSPIKVIGQDTQVIIPKDNKKRVYIYKKIDSSVRYLLKQELL